MESIRKWFYKPKRDDTSLLAQFFYADEALNVVAAELDSFDGRKDQERCLALVNHLRQCQDKVLTICNRIMDDVIPCDRANRDFRVKFPDDVMQENLAGQLWFGAECLAAGSSIMNRESESAAMRPLAKALTKALENVRNLLREQCLRGGTSGSNAEIFGERLQEALKIFDRLFAEFELSYVSAMVPVKTPREYELQQLVVVLFSETLQRALNMKLLTQDMVDDYDPALMFTIPRLAIVSGLLIFPDGPLCLDKTPADMSEMFRPFRTLLHKIRELLWTLNKKELYTLEKLLCSAEDPGDYSANGNQPLESQITPEELESNNLSDLPAKYPSVPDLDDFVKRFYIDYPSCKQFVSDFYNTAACEVTGSIVEGSATAEDCAVASWENQEDSDDETEWVGETSECETVVIDPCFGGNGSTVYSDASSKTSVTVPSSSEDTVTSDSSWQGRKNFCQLKPNVSSEVSEPIPVVSPLPFPSAALIASDFTLENEDTLVFHSRHCLSGTDQSITNNLDDLGQTEIINCAHISDENGQTDSGAAHHHELTEQCVKSLRTADNQEENGENNRHLPLDSHLSDHLQESRTTEGNESSAVDVSEKQWHVESIPCTCTLSARSTSNIQGPSRDKVDTQCEKVLNVRDCSENGVKILNVSASERKLSNVADSDILNNLDIQSNNISSATSGAAYSFNQTDNIPGPLSAVLGSERTCKCDTDPVIQEGDYLIRNLDGAVVNSSQRNENEEREKWVGVATGDGQCSLCSGNELRIQNQTRVLLLGTELDYSVNWDYLRRNSSAEMASSSGVKPEVSAPSGSKKPTGVRWQGKRRGFSSGVHLGKKQVPSPNLAKPVPIQDGRSLDIPIPGSYSSTCSSCPSTATASSDSCSMSSDTSSFNSECQDDEEIALAMQAAEIANRNEARAKFRSSEDLVHRLFVCIAGVADQLQTNFAGDLRNILKCVFLMSASQVADSSESSDPDLPDQECPSPDENGVEHAEEAWESTVEAPPPWVPDTLAPRCMACAAAFTVVRRRHHCRNCGKVFCARCSSNSVPLPRYGHVKPVRVCNRCFLYQVTPFTLEEATPTRS